MGSDESHFNVSLIVRDIIYLSLRGCHHQNDSCIKTGSDESHFNVSLIVRDKVTRQCPQITTFLKRKESRSEIDPEALLLTQSKSLTAGPNRLTTHAEQSHHLIERPQDPSDLSPLGKSTPSPSFLQSDLCPPPPAPQACFSRPTTPLPLPLPPSCPHFLHLSSTTASHSFSSPLCFVGGDGCVKGKAGRGVFRERDSFQSGGGGGFVWGK